MEGCLAAVHEMEHQQAGYSDGELPQSLDG
jgi:hypothetical protein